MIWNKVGRWIRVEGTLQATAHKAALAVPILCNTGEMQTSCWFQCWLYCINVEKAITSVEFWRG